MRDYKIAFWCVWLGGDKRRCPQPYWHAPMRFIIGQYALLSQLTAANDE